MNKSLKKTARRILGDPFYDYLLYSRFCYRAIKELGLPTGKAAGEEEYRRRWRQFSPWVDPYIYRLQSHFCGPTPDIIPEDILHRQIEATLNPRSYWDVYEDKTMFPRVIGADNVPTTIAARVRGGSLLDADFHVLPNAAKAIADTPYDALILKPSVDSCNGMRVMKFIRNSDGYITSSGQRLDVSFLMAYDDNFVLQEAVEQHPFTARLCPTAANTMRMVVYRSVVDNIPHLTSAYFRFGGPGAVVDNCHAGGRYVGVDLADGRLHDTSYDDHGFGAPFPDAGQCIPSWDKAVELSLHVARCIPHHHLFALDMAIDKNGKPMVLEYNIGGFSAHAGYFCGQTVFGPYIGEVMEWVLRKRTHR